MKTLLHKLAIKIGIRDSIFEPTSLDAALKRTVDRETKISTVIDIGASNGCWSQRFRKYYPNSFCFLVEANSYHQKALHKFKEKHKATDFVLAAAGDKEGEVYFDGADPFGGLASHCISENTNLRVPSTTVDCICKQYQLKPPYLLKLDTHGFELPIFDGAQEALKQTNLIVVETYNFNIAPGSLRFPQMCQYLEDKGFRCIDMSEPMYRSHDKAFWQFDLFFVPNSYPGFENNSWS